jgi:hypothetical protein
MPVNKPHLEFHRVDMNTGWSTPPGYPPGIEQKILAGGLDEERRAASRLLRFAPGVFTTAPFVHEYWEEVYLIAATSRSATMPKAGRRELSAGHLRLPATGRGAWPIQVIERRMPALRDPLLRGGCGLSRHFSKP